MPAKPPAPRAPTHPPLNAALSTRLRLALAIVAAVALTAAALALRHAASPEQALAWIAARRTQAHAHPALAAAAYFVFYVAFAALSLPGAWVVSVAAGALFGPWLGLPLALASSTAGATAAMLVARYLAREAAAARFAHFIAEVDKGVARDGARVAEIASPGDVVSAPILLALLALAAAPFAAKALRRRKTSARR